MVALALVLFFALALVLGNLFTKNYFLEYLGKGKPQCIHFRGLR